MFDQAKLAVVAYAEVSGANGSSTRTNSGIVTTRLALGTYALDLPVASQNQIGLQQFSDRDLIFIQPLGGTFPVMSNCASVNDNLSSASPYGVGPDTSQTRKLVFFGASSTTAVDSDFSVLILRTLTPPVPGFPA